MSGHCKRCSVASRRIFDLESACASLIALVKEEYPNHRTLADIATVWGPDIGDKHISDEQIAVLQRLYPKPLNSM